MHLDNRGVVQVCDHCGQRNRVPFSALGAVVKCGQCATVLSAVDSPIDIADELSFEALVSNPGLPVLIDFWAEWCGPCKMMAPELERLAAANSGKLVVAKANTEILPGLAQRFQISAIPTLALFRGGTEQGRIQGARPATQVQQFVDRFSE